MRSSQTIFLVFVAGTVSCAPKSVFDHRLQSLEDRPKMVITGTPGPDTITVNDAAGVICGSHGVTVQGAGQPTTLTAPEPGCPLSAAGHMKWTGFRSTDNNYFTGDFGAGDDRYTRIDGPGNDRFEYYAGDGDDRITSTDGPGDDEYLYNNGPGNDFSVHDSNGRISGGNDLYNIDGGPGTDRLEVLADGPGNDIYNFVNGERMAFNDTHLGDTDRFMSDIEFSHRLKRGLAIPSTQQPRQ